MKYAFSIAIFFSLLSCTTLNPGSETIPLSKQAGLPPHIHAQCKLFDLDGRLLRKLPGNDCLFENDGTSLSDMGDKVVKYDKNFKIAWKVPAKFIHHHMRKSPLTGDYLLIDSAETKVGQKTLRRDILRVISPSGKELKSADFYKLLKENGRSAASGFGSADWMEKFRRESKENFEYSHVNSFYQYAGGYVVNCFFLKKIFLINSDLTKITDVIDVWPRGIHDVQMSEPGKLIFYQNYSAYKANPRFSSIVEFDLQSRTFKEIYSANSARFSGHACGSVQLLGNRRFLITHSNCTPAHDAVATVVLEYVDLNTAENAVMTFVPEFKFGRASLIDASGFLKNNSGP